MESDLLHQDFDIRVIPYRNSPGAYALSAEGVPSHRVEASLALGNQAWRLEGFLRAVASSLLRNHEVWLEVTFDSADTPFSVFGVDGVRQTNTGSLVQDMPSRDEYREWFGRDDEWEPEVELEADRMVHILLPDGYSSQLPRQVVSDLAEIDSNLTPAWVMDQLVGQRRDAPPFDVSEASRTRQLRIAQAALPIGWTAREALLGSSRQVSDYYHSWRELRFLHFCSSMRERAEEALRQVLTLAGEECGFAASVLANGIHTPDEVKGFTRKFEAGELSFSEVRDIISEQGNGEQSERRRVL